MILLQKKQITRQVPISQKMPNSSREVINGAMKVISGLDWLEREIHYPEN